VPVSFPVSADWFGSSLLHIGPARTAPFWAVAAFDPATGLITALRPGTVQLGVTVNSTTKTTPVQITW
jgi:hypothetical protein